MRRPLTAVMLLTLMFVATTALAMPAPGPVGPYRPGPYGCNLRWDKCFRDGGAINRSFACDTNSGFETLVGSFVPAWDITSVSGLELNIDLASAGTTLPAWWLFKNAGSCRTTSLGANFTVPASAVNCADWSLGQASGGIGAYSSSGFFAPNTARLTMAIAVPPSALVDLTGRLEYFAFNLAINHAKTVGTGSCAGCTTPVCIVFNKIKMTTPIPSHDTYVQGPSNFTDSNYVTWQGGAGVSTGRGTGCPAATPTTQQTWGAVKALYR